VRLQRRGTGAGRDIAAPVRRDLVYAAIRDQFLVALALEKMRIGRPSGWRRQRPGRQPAQAARRLCIDPG
jgi:hypothetical protein